MWFGVSGSGPPRWSISATPTCSPISLAGTPATTPARSTVTVSARVNLGTRGKKLVTALITIVDRGDVLRNSQLQNQRSPTRGHVWLSQIGAGECHLEYHPVILKTGQQGKKRREAARHGRLCLIRPFADRRLR